MQYILLGCVIILSILGALEVIRILSYSMTSVPENSFTLLVQIKSTEECEYIIESLIERIRWSSIDFKALVLYNKENEEIREIAEKLISKYSNITLLSYEDLNYNHIINL